MLSLYDPKYHIALEASAGTGKTYNLTLRLLNILLKQILPDMPLLPERMQEVVALTFTNKAADEMKERLFEWLKVAMEAEKHLNDEKYALLFALEPDLKLLKEKAKKLYFLLLEHFSLLEISTIDSFMHSIIKLFPFELGLRLDVEIIEEAKERLIFDEALDRVLIEILNKPDLKEGLLELYRQEVISYGLRRWLARTFRSFMAYQSQLEDFKGFEENINAFNLKELEVKAKEAVKEFINTIKPYVKHKTGKKTMEEMENFRSLKEIISNSLFTKTLLNEHNHFKNLPSFCEDAFIRAKSCLKEYVLKTNYYQAKLLFELYKKFYKHYTEIKNKENVITFFDLSLLCYKLLVKENFFEDKRDFFYYRLDRKIKHLLLDEFQDTSVIQWQVFEPIANELVAGIGTKQLPGSFFYVGDKKQAIYRFRGGEAKLFDYVKERFKGYIKEETLPINYRSAGGLVKFVNKIGEYLQKEYDFPFSFQKAKRNDAPYYIYFSLIPPDDEELILGKEILKKIKMLHKAGFSYKDIAILVRRREQAEKILPVLKEADIPIQEETEVLLLKAKSVKAVVSLLHYLNNPKDKLNLMHFLKSIKKDLKDKKIEKIKKEVDLIPLPTLLEKIYNEFNLFSIYNDKLNLLQLMEVAYQFEKNYPRSLKAFLDYLEENKESLLQAKESLDEAVQIMTVHKAKGLEFEAVILSETTYDCKKIEEVLIFLQDENFSLKNIYIRPKSSEAEICDELKKALEYAKKRQLQDELNLLYVALTRAKTALYILAQPQKRNNVLSIPFHCWANFIGYALGIDVKNILKENHLPFCLYEEGELPFYEKKKTPSVSKFSFSYEFLKKSLNTEKEKFPEIISPKKEQKFGEAFHYVMSCLKTKRDDLKKAILKAKANFGLYLTQKEWEDIKERAKRVLNHPFLKPFFESNIKILNEAPFLWQKETLKAYRADRVVFLEEKIVIIDYKTSFLEEAAYKEQINEYKALLKKIYPEKEIEGYLVYVLKEKVEVKQI